MHSPQFTLILICTHRKTHTVVALMEVRRAKAAHVRAPTRAALTMSRKLARISFLLSNTARNKRTVYAAVQSVSARWRRLIVQLLVYLCRLNYRDTVNASQLQDYRCSVIGKWLLFLFVHRVANLQHSAVIESVMNARGLCNFIIPYLASSSLAGLSICYHLPAIVI